jgi:hypothetical protein
MRAACDDGFVTATDVADYLASQPPPPPLLPPPPPAQDLPKVAITISPVHLILPVAELTAEVRVAPKFGVAGIIGVGSVPLLGLTDDNDDRATVFELGASGRYYVLGSFRRGLQLGAEALYLHAKLDSTSAGTVKGSGLALAPFVGYKYTHRSGFTFDGQLGVSFTAVRAESSSDAEDDSDVAPLLNLNIGWSF